MQEDHGSVEKPFLLSLFFKMKKLKPLRHRVTHSKSQKKGNNQTPNFCLRPKSTSLDCITVSPYMPPPTNPHSDLKQ